jgi:hypothetical protein
MVHLCCISDFSGSLSALRIDTVLLNRLPSPGKRPSPVRATTGRRTGVGPVGDRLKESPANHRVAR